VPQGDARQCHEDYSSEKDTLKLHSSHNETIKLVR
jgi:hypothetical protein